MELLFTWDAAEKLTGVAINLACSSQEVENADYVSADFWHDVRLELRKHHGEGLFVLPLCGAAGDQSPHLLFRKQAEATLRTRKGGLAPRQEIGQRVAAAVAAGLELAQGDIRRHVPFAHNVQLVPLPVRKVTQPQCEAAKKGYQDLEVKGLDGLERARLHPVADEPEYRRPLRDSGRATLLPDRGPRPASGRHSSGHEPLRTLR